VRKDDTIAGAEGRARLLEALVQKIDYPTTQTVVAAAQALNAAAARCGEPPAILLEWALAKLVHLLARTTDRSPEDALASVRNAVLVQQQLIAEGRSTRVPVESGDASRGAGCRGCGCTDEAGCVQADGSICHWVDPAHTICSNCLPADDTEAGAHG
jgi:hypothetical protein